ncbi:MAG: ParA family protein [Acidobacteria bacterium]|nr:ParA family protein [Acidobacteriota bacterium]
MPTLALINQKGGVGKTTVTLGLASIAQSRGNACCVIDIDPQANATSGLGVWEPKMTIDRLLSEDHVGSAATAMTPSLWPNDSGPVPMVLASRGELAAIEQQLLVDPVGGQDRLARVLQGIAPSIRFIDCPPSLGLLSVNALFAADRVAVVTEPSAWATDAVAQILSTVARINERRSVPLEMSGIVVNRLGRTRDARYWHEHLVEAYPTLCLPPIHLRAAVAEASAQSLPLMALGARPGTSEAVDEFSVVYDKLVSARAEDQQESRHEL